MTALALLLLTVGALLAAFGTAGFLAISVAPDPESVRFTKRAATIGRWMATPGVVLYLGHGGSHGTPMISVLLLAALAALASFITKANLGTGTRPARA